AWTATSEKRYLHRILNRLAWYDNEYGFVTQLIRTLEKFAKL
ncbi:hypothetical protein, partial [Escherichia coli]